MPSSEVARRAGFAPFPEEDHVQTQIRILCVLLVAGQSCCLASRPPRPSRGRSPARSSTTQGQVIPGATVTVVNEATNDVARGGQRRARAIS